MSNNKLLLYTLIFSFDILQKVYAPNNKNLFICAQTEMKRQYFKYEYCFIINTAKPDIDVIIHFFLKITWSQRETFSYVVYGKIGICNFYLESNKVVSFTLKNNTLFIHNYLLFELVSPKLLCFYF